VTFADDPLGVSTTVKAQHVTQLMAAMNTLRAAAGLGAINITGVAPGQPILASQITAIYNGVNEARAAFGAALLTVPADLAAGQPVRMTHIQSLRDSFH